ncbi:MAG TPA: cell division topological specificity factor MinE [Candidatus Elarobacter sp.]|nr:cell division topological specificity factor MinE [Candidatus Elarobacter sp.]
MLQFIQRFFGKPPSSATARERLRLVLLSDHLSLAPDVVEALKHDLIDVISRYLEVDVPNCDVTFEQREKEIAMLANIPILGMHPRPVPPPPPAPPPPPSNGNGAVFEPAAADAAIAVAEPPAPAAAPRTPKPKTKANGVPNGHRPVRRKRRKGVTGPAPATG